MFAGKNRICRKLQKIIWTNEHNNYSTITSIISVGKCIGTCYNIISFGLTVNIDIMSEGLRVHVRVRLCVCL